MPFVAVAALTLPAGFLVAELTGRRPVGGVVLVVGLVACLVLARRAGVAVWGRAVVVVVALALFVAAHLVDRVLPPAAAVVLAGALVGAAAAAVTPWRRRRRSAI